MEMEANGNRFSQWVELLIPQQLLRGPDAIYLRILATVTIAVVLPLAGFGWTRWKRICVGRKKLPGPWSLPLIGHVTKLSQSLHLELTRWHERYGDVYEVQIGRSRVVVIGGWEAILEGLMDRSKTMSHRPNLGHFNIMYDKELGRQRGLCTSDPDDKHEVRRSFLCSSIGAYCNDGNLASEVIDTVNRLLHSPQPCDPMAFFKPACFNVMLRVVLDYRFDPREDIMKETLVTMEGRCDFLQLNPVDFCPMLKLFHTSDFADFIQTRTKIQKELWHKFINFYKDSYERNCIRNMTDYLLRFMEDGDDFGLLDHDDIDYLLLDIVNFGFKAMAVALTWLLGYVASDLDLQSEIHEELDRVVGHHRLPGLEDQPFLPLTTAVIFETLRHAAVHPFLIPHSASKDTVLQGYHIQKKSIVLFNIWKMNHDSSLWKDPHSFQPRRFLNKENLLEIPDYFVPFGAGQRQCPGESLADVGLFLFFATILHQTSIKPGGDDFKLVPEGSTLLQPKTFHIHVAERQRKSH